MDRRLIVDDVIAPLWEPEGRSIIVAHNSGLERISLDGKRTNLNGGQAVAALALSPDGAKIVYSDGRNIRVLDRFDARRESLLDEDFVPRFGNRRIRALAFSPDGKRIAFGAGHEVFVIDIDSKTPRRIYDAPLGVYWLAWLPSSGEIALLCGREDRGRGLHATWTSGRSGKYSLAVVGEEGGFRRKLFSAHLIDVRRAAPDLSPDGRYVSLTAVEEGAEEIVVVATDGSGAALLTSSGPNGYASWYPLR